jgi:hypothetical protein
MLRQGAMEVREWNILGAAQAAGNRGGFKADSEFSAILKQVLETGWIGS